jgi:flagellar hook protein FlgE
MPSFSTSLSGLNANSLALSVIANNLANLNTIAYKEMTPIFRDLFYQQVGSNGAGDPLQVGVGAMMSSIASPFTPGNIDSTGVPTDCAIQGNGFFLVDNNGMRSYTRAGNFTIDTDGRLVNDDGAFVLGYQAVNGVISPSQTLGPLSIASGQMSPPQATSNVSLTMNLDASAAVNGSFSTPVAVFDSLGTSHVLTFTFTKTAANTWNYQITVPAEDVSATGTPVTVSSGSLTFDGAGKLTTPAADVAGITVNNLADGADAMNLTWNLYDDNSSPVVTQVAGPSATSTTRQDGFSSGTLRDYSITGDGLINGVLSNGQTLALGQIALATFPNPQGLMRNGANGFLASLSAGLPNVGAPGTGGRGTLMGGALESSNVDIAREFAQLITAQRGYQANARAITTADEVTQEAINLKR